MADDTTTAIILSSRASGLAFNHQQGAPASVYHATDPEPGTLAEIKRLLELDTVDAVVQLLVPIMKTMQQVVQRSAFREQTIMGGPGISVTINGVTSALTMSLNDFVTAVGEVAGIETPEAERMAELINQMADEDAANEPEQQQLVLP